MRKGQQLFPTALISQLRFLRCQCKNGARRKQHIHFPYKNKNADSVFHIRTVSHHGFGLQKELLVGTERVELRAEKQR